MIILALCIPLAFVAGGFVAYKGVQLGLRWQMQTAKQEQPSMAVKNPIQPIIQAKQAEQQEKEQANILAEWLNGPTESR